MSKKRNTENMGRPKIKDSEKVLYQRMAFEYPTYKRFKKIIDDKKSENKSIVISEILDEILDVYESATKK
jgi:hypothetical protein